jgi:hypothetical protein
MFWTMKKFAAFLRPQLVTLLVFFAMVFFLPVVYVSIFPAHTGVPFPREREMEWILKVEWYGASLDEYLYGTDGKFALMLGILYRNYFINRIGLLLLILYYTLASGVNVLIKKIPFFSPILILALAACVPSGQSPAEAALRDFFSALAQKDYPTVTNLYGGEYEILTEWNPDILPSEYETLWRRGCEQNGLACLSVKDILAVKTEGSQVTFTVTFQTADGRLFETGEPVISTFDVIVSTDDSGAYKIFSLPPYVP